MADELEKWKDLSEGEKAFQIYCLMLDKDGSSSLKTIVAQCLASLLRWGISENPNGQKKESMFDIDLYGMRTDESKRNELKQKIEGDKYLEYIVKAIKYAAGEEV